VEGIAWEHSADSVGAEGTAMVESIVARIMLDLSIVLLIAASVTEVVVDVRGGPDVPALPPRLRELPSSDPGTALAAAGVCLLALGTLIELVVNVLPGGRLIVAFVGLVAFLFTGGFVVDEEQDDAGYGG